jgi:hypothetical protein
MLSISCSNQPALDHIVNNMDNEVPSGNADSASAADSTAKPIDLDDDDEEDQEGLKAHIQKMGGDPSKANDAEAKSVKCTDVSLPPACWFRGPRLMYYAFTVRQDLQEHVFGFIPR